MMIKNVLFAVALLSVALCTGCATGGGGHTGAQIQVTVSTNPPNQSVVGVTLTVQFTAVVSHTDNQAVTWSLNQSGVACTAACGTITANGLYTAPSTPPNPPTVNVTATSQANPTKSDTANMKVLPITVIVTPGTATVQKTLQQQFTATILPDAAPQTVTWSITDCPSGPCGSIDANGLYTAPNSIPNTVSVQAVSSVDPPNWVGKSNLTIVNSRLSGTFVFQVSGFDSSNKPLAIAGNLVVDSNGNITNGGQDELEAGVHRHCNILTSSSFSADNNNHGTLILNTTGGACAVNTRKYKIVLNAAGSGQLLEFDSNGRSSGQILLASTSAFRNDFVTGTFVFGFTGSDAGNKRAGMAGVFQADGAGNIASTGSLDINDNGSATASNGFDTSQSQYNIAADGSGTLTLVSNGLAYNFAIYVISGKMQSPTNPLTLFAISTDSSTNHGVSGTVVFQDPNPTGSNTTYGLNALSDFSVSDLTGADSTGLNAQASLTLASGDKNGNFSGTFDANNAGSIVAAKTFTSTYKATGNGRYTIDLLNPAVHFVLYLSAANQGFLLDQSGPVVFTGAMNAQPGNGAFANSSMTGSFDAATSGPATPGASQVASNLLVVSGSPDFTVSGQQDETDGGQNPGQTVAGTCNVSFDGTGTIKLTQPATANYVIYALDTSKQGQAQHFLMINVDATNTNPSIIFAER